MSLKSSPHVCMSIHNQCQSCFDIGRVLVLNDPSARVDWRVRPQRCVHRGRRGGRSGRLVHVGVWGGYRGGI
jgi:hypothetical protein